MEVETVSTEAASRAMKALDSLDSAVKAFRERSKNDIASMKAASDRVQGEVTKMAQQYAMAQQMLTAPEFERAIENAERLAVALEAIARLSETKVKFSVFGGAS